MKRGRIVLLSTAINYILSIALIGGYFSLDLPLNELVDNLLKSLIFAIPLGLLITYISYKYRVDDPEVG